MNALFRVNWKKKICSLVLSLTLMGSMAAVAGAQQTPALHTETVAVPQYLQSTSEQTQSTTPISLLAMDQNAKEAETVISEGLMNGVSVLDLRKYQISKDQLLRILNYSSFTNYPQIASVISYEYTIDNQETVYGLWPQYNVSQKEVAAKSAQINQAAQAVISSVITSDMTQLQQIVAIHDYLVLNCSYDTSVETNSAPHDSYTAYGALVKQKAVCQGYAAAFQLMMQKLGIPGIVVQSTAMNHAWNMVRYNNEWYHVDATWDDPVPDRAGVVQTYALLKSDTAMTGGVNQHYSWDSAGYVAVNTQFDTVTDWSQYRVVRTAIARGAQLDISSLAGTVSTYSEFLVKPYQTGTQVTVTTSNPAVATVQLVNANDPRGQKYRVVYQGAGSATVLVTTSDGGLKTVPITVQSAALAA
ncbi:transglutaminase domain-containing protein [Faecalispora anaeroviscerum]|uniref:transglutaminase domain-containing protein n=1 Tax=Faecalispora anaeroviscerum TaxID=2991836 RepID=UPI0024B9531A|nr:transglutaminase domain-containing protein [Faecalispora anaeroviscerum]